MKSLFSFLALSFVFFGVSAQQLVLPGDYPDPSVVKIGKTYWASATTSNWFPAYPLLKSKDLVHWKTAGNVFNKKPDWVDYYFWAPEISYENGKVYIYYAAHKKGGNLCLGVASADKPEGPYTDHGPLMCEAAGSIDAFPMRDENGKLFLIWKEDGNSVRQPTPIWAMEMNEERTALVGEKKELFRNTIDWERNLVEGVSMMRHGDYFYAFYAAAGCCGAGCTYATGIARSKTLFGPWERYNKNPLLANNEEWKCQGHGTPVEKNGRYYFLYHGYDTKSTIYTGRQGLLNEFRFTADGWIEFLNESSPGVTAPARISDNFKGKSLSTAWQWSVFQDVGYKVNNKLEFEAMSGPAGAFLGQKTYSADYSADALISLKETDAAAGIALIGDEKNLVSLMVKGDSLNVVRLRNNVPTILASKLVPGLGDQIFLRAKVSGGKDIIFSYSTDGKQFTVLNETAANGSYLPPWDRAVRAGLVSQGVAGQKAVFKNFTMIN